MSGRARSLQAASFKLQAFSLRLEECSNFGELLNRKKNVQECDARNVK